MYQLSRTIAFILFSLILISTTTHSAERCSMNGRWSIAEQSNVNILLNEIDSKVTALDSYSYSPCGTAIFEGTNNGYQFTIKQYMSNQHPEACRNVVTYVGVFNPTDCSIVEGTMSAYFYFTDDNMAIPFTWYRNIIKIQNPNPNTDLIITAEPRMPKLTIEAILTKPNPMASLSRAKTFSYMAPPFTWHVKLDHTLIKNSVEYAAELPDVETSTPNYTPDFSLLRNRVDKTHIDGGVLGGKLTVEVELYKTVSDKQIFVIKGTNPGRRAIEKLLVDPLSRKIACVESRYKQFKGDIEGGVGTPVVGKNLKGEEIGGAGIMQIFREEGVPPKVAWNWKDNIEAGLQKISDSSRASKIAHITERGRLNKERIAKGLSACPAGVPTSLDEDQQLREAIRRYNCGVEYRWEPRDAPNCEGAWIVYHIDRCKKGDENYIDKVLSCEL